MLKKWALLYLGASLAGGCSPSVCCSCQSTTVFGPAIDQLDFDNAVAVDARYDAAHSSLIVHLRLQPGYHVYALGELVGRPLDIVILPQGGWSMQGPVHLPAGRKKKFGDETSMLLEGEVAISVALRPGQGPIHAVLKLHLCADGACDRPRDYPVVVPVAATR